MKLLIIAAALLVTASAAAMADVTGPAKVTTLHQDLTGHHSFTIEWDEPGDDCSTGNATTFEVRYSSSNITDANWQSALVLVSSPAKTNGQEDCAEMTINCSGPHGYYFCVFVIDEAGNRSPISNVVQASASCTGTTEVECYGQH